MLVLSRKLNEQILIGDDTVITVVKVGKGRVKLGIKAPGKSIARMELIATKEAEKEPAK